ncbi:MAG: carbohydrate kinase family protein [Candidatus Bathyarchaeia archaeon]
MSVICAGILVFDLFAIDLPRIPEPGEVIYVPKKIEMHVGGHAANVAINLRQLRSSCQRISLVGAVGMDIFGNYIERFLKKYGIVVRLQRVRKAGTSKDLVLVVKGQDRRYHVDVGANLHLSPNHVSSIIREEKPLIFYVGATGMLGKFDEELSHILKYAKSFGCLTFVDPIFPIKFGWEFLLDALKWTDILHCNDYEATSMTGERDLERAATILIEKGVDFLVITRGERGLVAKTKKVALKMPAFSVPVVDPSGAGDAFCAGLISKLLQSIDRAPPRLSHLSHEKMKIFLLEGSAAGAACVTAVGTTTAVTRENVDRLLNLQGSRILNSTEVIVSNKEP